MKKILTASILFTLLNFNSSAQTQNGWFYCTKCSNLYLKRAKEYVRPAASMRTMQVVAVIRLTIPLLPAMDKETGIGVNNAPASSLD